MDTIKITPKKLEGEVCTPPSKSISHRAIITAAFAKGESKVRNLIFSDDINVTLQAMKVLGANCTSIDKNENGTHDIVIEGGIEKKDTYEEILCKESGSTLRFLIPIAMNACKEVAFKGEGRLVERPLDVYYDIFDKKGITYSNVNGKLPLIVSGELTEGEYTVRGDISSQFITGLLFALSMKDGDSTIKISNKLESRGYIDLTLDTMNDFGVEVQNNNYESFFIKGSQQYNKMNYIVEGDYSQAAFWLVAGAISTSDRGLTTKGVRIPSKQGDSVIVDILKEMGANVEEHSSRIKVKNSDTTGITIDVSECPDIAPILTVLGAVSKGTTKIVNAKRVRIKESDRLKAMTTELNKLGADIEELEDSLIIKGKESLKGGVVDSWNDHRIAMALAIASTRCTEPVILTGAESVNKSYPHFWEDFKSVGGTIDEWNMGK